MLTSCLLTHLLLKRNILVLSSYGTLGKNNLVVILLNNYQLIFPITRTRLLVGATFPVFSV